MNFYTSIIDIDYAQEIVIKEHYLHRQVNRLARPFAYGIFTEPMPDQARINRVKPARIQYPEYPLAVFVFGIPHFTRLKGVFGTCKGNEGCPTQWQTLMNFRNWVNPKLRELQGDSYSVSQHLAPILRRLEVDYLRQFGVVDPEQAWRIVQVISYADNQEGHKGTMYKALNFEELGTTKRGYASNPGASSGRHTGGIQTEESSKAKTLYRYWLPKKRPMPELWIYKKGK